MSFRDCHQYGIFDCNSLLKSTKHYNDGEPRTVLLGQLCLIQGVLKQGILHVRLLKDGDTWESQTYITTDERCIVPVATKLWQFVAAIASPQERLKLCRNKDLCEQLQSIGKDMIVGFTDTTDVRLGIVRHIGNIKGLGYGYGIELHERKPGNKCTGSSAGIQYFQCLPGYGVFTTIERVRPTYNTNAKRNLSLEPDSNNFDEFLTRNVSSLFNGFADKPPREDIVTKYGEYSKTFSAPAKTAPIGNNLRNSLSLQNIVDVEGTVNTNNDFDQNTMIQPDKSQLMNSEKLKNKSEMDLYDLIGNSWHNSDLKSENNENTRKNLDKNDNIKEKYSPLSNRNNTISSSSNGTLNRSPRNKSVNPISHILDNTGTMKKTTKFYGDEYIKNGIDKVSNNKTDIKKSFTSKKLNEAEARKELGKKGRSDERKEKNQHVTKEINQPKATATFYVIEKDKYQDPAPGTTNDLVVGSLVEVGTDVTEQPLYGVIRWMGFNTDLNFTLVGIELEEDLPSDVPLELTDGTHNGERFFKCSNDRAFFVPLDRCRKDPRFQDAASLTPVPQATISNGLRECPGIPGAMAPLCMPTENDVEAVCGKGHGIQGHNNSCYLDVTLFAMFTYTSVFDSLLFRPKNQDDISDYDEVQRVLREEIVNPLRKNLFVSADNVMKLRKLLDRLSSVSGLTSEEKDPEEFLNSLLAQILKAEPFLELNSGQTAFHYQLFVEKDAKLTLPTVQQLFEQSFLTSDIKLKQVPSCLIVQMPRFGKNYKMYPRILPSQLLDVTDVIEGSPRQCIVCGKLATWECKECFAQCSSTEGLESTAFCPNCLVTAHKHERRQRHTPRELIIDPDFAHFLSEQEHFRPPRLYMELFAVICIETSHYVTFVKCGVGHEAPWCFFDSMADRKGICDSLREKNDYITLQLTYLGERDGYNIPEMVACPDISRWLSDEAACRRLHEEFPVDRHLPEHARRLLCDAYICMYQSSDVMMYR